MTVDAASWIGPAIVAAVISALVTGIGWYVSERQASRREVKRRRERVIDVQTALLADIRADQHRMGDVRTFTAEVIRTLADHPDFTPFVPRQAPTFLLEALLPEIYILPNAVIDPVILYYRQITAVALFVDDLRSDRFAALGSDRKQAMYADYARLLLHADLLGKIAAEALTTSLNMTAVVPSVLLSGEGLDEAGGPDEASRSGP